MSAYIRLATPMTDEDCLVAALLDTGVVPEAIVRSAHPIALRGWQRDRTAHIVLRREHTDERTNDIGFLRTETGYVAVLSNDASTLGAKWLSRVIDRYRVRAEERQARLAAEERRRADEQRRMLVEAQRTAVHERAKKLGYRVEETREGEGYRLVLVKRTY